MPRKRAIQTLCLGLAAATLTGLAAGGGLKPQLKELAGGPQIMIGSAGERSSRSDFGLASWPHGAGPIPDYVVGTDWLSAQTPPEFAFDDAPVEYAFDWSYVSASDAPPPPPSWRTAEAPPPRPHYPSEGGDILGGVGPSPPAHSAAF